MKFMGGLLLFAVLYKVLGSSNAFDGRFMLDIKQLN